ncbi:hypothetical protein ATO6_04975 [Oceanicola sp. 22II-s10i]|uniref:zinc ABC transporter substrate-binding protein n=1 Tax=Oceanicola sp. 22II-s10i TaxID=1317116 RepID=UPI000B51FA06|nr:zinc ABC transporter substrate-binding protein [Oceanicola sp. 22II-s10i]OWU86203.1 hypothetical protein ATO6_04975 [Oceanicola sp. 22II-s10i]
MRLIHFALIATLATPLAAEPPRVATDILPIHSLVASVMQGVGTPDLLVSPGASPHGYALRPSEARALSEADLVIWVGHGITPWLEESLPTLAPDATSLELLEAEGTLLLANREADHHDHADEGHEEDDDHADHADEHNHGDSDPHAWLDPRNARIWTRLIAEDLAARDPENAETYRANADRAEVALTELETTITSRLDGVEGEFITFHDAYQYFEARFGLTSHAALSPSDARQPGPARIAALRDEVAEHGITCLFAEPQFNPRQIETLANDLGVNHGTLDPVGADMEPGSELYPALLTRMADSLAACLRG